MTGATKATATPIEADGTPTHARRGALRRYPGEDGEDGGDAVPTDAVLSGDTCSITTFTTTSR